MRLLLQLRQFEADPTNVAVLTDLQNDLYRCLSTVERRASRLNKNISAMRSRLRRERLPRERSRILKRNIARSTDRKQDYQDLCFFLRSIGDGVAFTMFDQYDLKPLAFKEHPGALIGKTGRRRELHILRRVLKHGVRVILCDLTNVLRYGDICYEKFGLPLFAEIKSSKNVNARTERQVEAIRKMALYLLSDETEGLYGIAGSFKRRSTTEHQRGHADKLTALIDEAYAKGTSWTEAEPGLRYIVMRRFKSSELDAATANMSRVVFDTLNHHKYSGIWASYFPFALSIRNPGQCLDFAAGKFVIAVAYDIARAQSIADACGYLLTTDPPRELHRDLPDNPQDYWWLLPKTPSPDPNRPEHIALGMHFLGRLLFEFASLEWVITQGCTISPPEDINAPKPSET